LLILRDVCVPASLRIQNISGRLSSQSREIPSIAVIHPCAGIQLVCGVMEEILPGLDESMGVPTAFQLRDSR
jgi:hypothetical protein